MSDSQHTVDDSDIKIHGPVRRNAGLLLGVVFVVLVGPSITRVLKNYRAVVLTVQNDKMFLAQEKQPPMWVDAIDAKPGDMVQKDSGSWSPMVAEPELRDRNLQKTFKRFVLAYEGVVVKINAPKGPGSPSTAVIQLDDGTRRSESLWGKHLATVEVGSRVRKESETWEPVIVDDELVDIERDAAEEPEANTP